MRWFVAGRDPDSQIDVLESAVIDHERRHMFQKLSQELFCFGGKRRFFGDFGQCVSHKLHPSIARSLVDAKGRVPGSQPGMAALLDISWGTTESIDEKVSQALLSARKIVGWVHRSQNVVGWNLAIECSNKPSESGFSKVVVDVNFLHGYLLSKRDCLKLKRIR
jgi:hypothetical protein